MLELKNSGEVLNSQLHISKERNYQIEWKTDLMNYLECRRGPRRVENMKGDRTWKIKMRKSKCISTQNSRGKKKRAERTKRGNIWRNDYQEFSKTMEEQAFTDAWHIAYTKMTNV